VSWGKEESAGKTDHDCEEKEKSAFDRLQSRKRMGPTVHTPDQDKEEAQEDGMFDDVYVVGDTSESQPPSSSRLDEEKRTKQRQKPRHKPNIDQRKPTLPRPPTHERQMSRENERGDFRGFLVEAGED
jgi:hypothetical protein